MANFNFCNDTEIFFGKDTQKNIGELAKKCCKTDTVMLVSYESRSRGKIIDEIKESLEKEGLKAIEYNGAVPNPTLERAQKGIEIARENNIGLLIGIGGGSACDLAKAIALGCNHDGDMWEDFYVNMADPDPEKVIPVGVVITMAGTGTETSFFAVLTNEAIPLKIGYGVPAMRPAFAVLNPELTYSVPTWQTVCGTFDMFAHVMDAYVSRTDDMPLTYSLSEATMRTIVDMSAKVLRDPQNYEARAQLMLAGTLAMGKFVSMGLDTNLALHTMAEDLGAVYNATHGATLSALMPAYLTYLKKEKLPLLARYAVEVWHVEPSGASMEETADEGIRRTKEWIVKMGLPGSLKGLGIDFEKDGKMLADRIGNGGDWGDAYMFMDSESAYELYKMAANDDSVFPL